MQIISVNHGSQNKIQEVGLCNRQKLGIKTAGHLPKTIKVQDHNLEQYKNTDHFAPT